MVFSIALLSCCLSTPLYSQSKIQEFEHISVEQGLSQGAVTSIVQDDFGFLWFGTRDGLNRYDGLTFTVTGQYVKDFNPFSGQSISQLSLGKENRLWIGTEYNGISLLTIATGQLKTYQHNSTAPSSLSSNAVTSILEDNGGNVWVGTTNAGLNQGVPTEKGISFRHYRKNFGRQSIASDIIRSIYQDHENRIWICTPEGVCLYDKNIDGFRRFVFQGTGSNFANTIFELATGEVLVSFLGGGLFQLVVDLSSVGRDSAIAYSWKRFAPSDKLNFVNSMFEDKKGSVWLCTSNNGLIEWNRITNSLIQSTPFEPSDRSLSFSNILTIFVDRTDVMWLGTNGGGIFKHDLAKNSFIHLRHEDGNPYSLFYSSVRGMCEDDEKKIWIGGYGALNLYDPASQLVERFFNPKGGANNDVYSITENPADKNILFLGTEGLGVKTFNKQKKIFDNSLFLPKQKSSDIDFTVYDMLVDRSNRLWVATQKGLFRSRLPVNFYSIGRPFLFEKIQLAKTMENIGVESSVTVVTETLDGAIWIGTKYHGFAKWSAKSSTFEFVQNNPKDKKSLSTNSIKSIFEDWQGGIWIGTDGGGVNHWKNNDRLLLRNNFEKYSTGNGLPNNVVYGILEDKQHNIWVSTNKGLTRINPENKTFRTFSKHDGLQGSEFNTASFLKSSDGKLYFGGVNGVTIFKPEQLTINSVPPQVAITSIKVNNDELSLPRKPFSTDTLRLSYVENNISFDFVALSFNSPEKNSYAYFMEGIDNDWVQAGERRYANYTQVNPGEYTFHVKAANQDGVWNDVGAKMMVIILPPFWLTWWFKTIIIFMLVFITPTVIIRRIQALKRAKEAQLKITRTIIERQEQDRMRIARELHDSLGQEIIVLKNRAHLAKDSSLQTQKAKDQLTTIEEIANRAISSIQSIVHDLRPIHLDRIGLTETLKILLKRIKESTGLNVSWQIENIDNQLQKEFEIIIFRCVQETFNNILKHSHATTGTCEIGIESNMMKILIWDNGIGTPFHIDTRTASEEKISTFGFGIQNMIERINFIGGSLVIRSAQGKGTNVMFEIPIIKDKK